MLQPSYTQIMKKLNDDATEKVVTSRYSIVIATARRAREIIDIVNQDATSKSNDKNAEKVIDPAITREAAVLNEKLKLKKPTSIAVDELYSGRIKIKEHIIEG